MERLQKLSRREREIMDIVYAGGPVTAGEVRERMAAPPSYSAVRATLRVLEEKDLLRHEAVGTRYVYRPVVDRGRARRSAMRHLVDTFFEGSAASAVLTLLERPGTELTHDELDRMSALIDRARKEGR
jgi:predicted transcriptional regulator